jgi:hypothetical protein
VQKKGQNMATLLTAEFVYRGIKYEALCDWADWDNSETIINRADGRDVSKESKALKRAADAAIERAREEHRRELETES